MTLELAEADCALIRTIVGARAGIELGEEKNYLIRQRVEALLRLDAFNSPEALLAKLNELDPSLCTLLVDAMTTNETSFFRDRKPFLRLRDEILPRVIEHNRIQKRIRIWSCACSSGQEPLSIAMVIRERFPELAKWDVKIIATDLSPTMIQRAHEGAYTQAEVNRGLPARLLNRFFVKRNQEWWAKDEIRQLVEYHNHNLLESWAWLPTFDIVFMRHVLIYLSQPTRQMIAHKLATKLASHGALILGASETLSDFDESLKDAEEHGHCWGP